jgi:hypoxanthine phosphoribosyltransferase
MLQDVISDTANMAVDDVPLPVSPRQLPMPQVRISAQEIDARIQAMAAEINAAYADCESLIIIGILKGSVLFLADLIRHITVPCKLEFIQLASYNGGKSTSGQVRPVNLTLPSLAGQDVLIVEDIVDTGLTMAFFLQYLKSLHQTRSIRLAVLLDKPETRTTPIAIDFAGFEVKNEFLVGYGLDYGGYFRNLPYIGILTPDA